MKTKIFRIKGKFPLGDQTQVFTKELKALSEENIYERIHAEFGSKHHLKKNDIIIEEIKEISLEDALDPLVTTIS
jgi:large subunit ribosomal protein LX